MTIEIRVMPAAPTQEALDAIDALFSPGFCDGRMERGIYKAIFNALTAVPTTTQAPIAYRIVHNDGHKGGWVDGSPSAIDFRDAKEGVIQAVEQAYAHSDTVEVERLRTENETFDSGMRNLACQLSAGGYNAESLSADQLVEKVQWGVNNLAECNARLVDTLRAQLTEQEALLRDLLTDAIVPRIAGRIEAALSASAKPSAPVERPSSVRQAFDNAQPVYQVRYKLNDYARWCDVDEQRYAAMTDDAHYEQRILFALERQS